jgi:hypothetical protein
MALTPPSFETRATWLTPAEQRRYRPDRLDLGAQSKALLRALTQGAKAVVLQEIWFEAPIGADWVAAYRLSFQDDHRVVVGEIRIFPSAGPRIPNSGRWLGDVQGSKAPVPRGGIKTKTVLRAVKLRAFRQELRTLFDRQQMPLSIAQDERRDADAGAKRGRKPKPDQHYAKAAVLYERFFLDASARPTADVAKAMNLTPATARTTIATARKRGFLTGTERGESGGHATPRAHAALQKIATEVKTGGPKAAQLRVRSTKKARKVARRTSRA